MEHHLSKLTTSSATSNYAYASSNGHYHTVPTKPGQVHRISARFTLYCEAREEPFAKIRKHLAEHLASELIPYIDVQSDRHLHANLLEYTGTIGIAPLDTSTCVLNDQYTYCNQHFTQAEIDYAISQTYPERFI